MSYNHVNARPDELSGDLAGEIASPSGVVEIDSNIFSFRIAEGAQAA